MAKEVVSRLSSMNPTMMVLVAMDNIPRRSIMLVVIYLDGLKVSIRDDE